MRFKKMLVALVACMALSVVAANAAQAALHWNVNGAELTSPAEVSVKGGPWTLIATTLGTEVELTAAGVKCTATCTIEGAGKSKGGLTYTGVTVMKPAHCEASGGGAAVGTIQTEPLVDQIIMDPSGGTRVFDKFTPESGTTFVEVEFHGEECALNEFAIPVEGSATGEAEHKNAEGVLVKAATGDEATEQYLSFGSSQQATGGGSLTLGEGTAVLSGTAINSLASGLKFGATE